MILIQFIIFISVIGLFSVTPFLVAFKKGKASLRLLATCVVLGIAIATSVNWFFVRDTTSLVISIIFAVLNGMFILTIPWSMPELYKNMKIKW